MWGFQTQNFSYRLIEIIFILKIHNGLDVKRSSWVGLQLHLKDKYHLLHKNTLPKNTKWIKHLSFFGQGLVFFPHVLTHAIVISVGGCGRPLLGPFQTGIIWRWGVSRPQLQAVTAIDRKSLGGISWLGSWRLYKFVSDMVTVKSTSQVIQTNLWIVNWCLEIIC